MDTSDTTEDSLLSTDDGDIDELLADYGIGTSDDSPVEETDESETGIETPIMEEIESHDHKEGFFSSIPLLKILSTFPAWLTMFICGVSLVVPGTTLETLKRSVGDEISWTVFHVRALGVCSGSIIGGFITDGLIVCLQKKFSKYFVPSDDKGATRNKIGSFVCRALISLHAYILLIICVFFLSNVLIPVFPDFYIVNGLFFVQGYCFGAAQCAALVSIGWIWASNVKIPLQVFQLNLGAGVVLFPFAMQYVLKWAAGPDEIFYAYLVSAVFCLIPVPLLVLFPAPIYPELQNVRSSVDSLEEKLPDVIVKDEELAKEEESKDDEEEVEEVEKNVEEKGMSTNVGRLYYVFIGIFFVFIAATEVVLPGLIITFLTREGEDGPMDTAEGATKLVTLHFALYLLAKVFIIFFVAYIPIIHLMMVNLLGALICGLVLFFFPANLWAIRVAFVAAGFFVSPLFGLGLPIPSRYGVPMSGLGGACVVVGAAVGVGLTSSVAQIMDKSGDDTTLFASYLVFCCFAIILFALTMLLGSFIKIKYVLKDVKVGFKSILENM